MGWRDGDLCDLMPYRVVERFPSGVQASRFWSWGEAVRYQRAAGQGGKLLVRHLPKDPRGALLLLLEMRGLRGWDVWWERRHPGPGWFFAEDGDHRNPSLLGSCYGQAVEFIRGGTLDFLAKARNEGENNGPRDA